MLIKVSKGRPISHGSGEGKALISTQPISFLGCIDPSNGMIIESGHELEGECITDKVLIFPFGIGSTVGSYVMYQLKKNTTAPVAIINRSTEPIVAVGAIISDIPLVDSTKPDVFENIKTGDMVRVNGTTGVVEIL